MLILITTSYNICKNFQAEFVIRASTFVLVVFKKGMLLFWEHLNVS